MTAIVLFVGARAGKGNPLSMAISIEVLVDELTTIVRVQPQQREGQSLPHPVHCTTYALLSFPSYSNTLRPTTGYIHRRQGSQVEAFSTLTTVGYQVNFQEAKAVLLPVSKGSDGNGALKQAPRLGSGKGTTPFKPTPGAQ